MTAFVFVATLAVVTVMVADVEPVVTATLAGTTTAGSEDVRATLVPAGAGPLSCTVSESVLPP